VARTQVKSNQIGDGDVCRADLCVDRPGKAVIRRIVPGNGLSIESQDGADPGTGDVTLGLTEVTRRAAGVADFGPSMIPEIKYAEAFIAADWVSLVDALELMLSTEPTADHGSSDGHVEGIKLYIDDIEPGNGVYLHAYAPHGTFGAYNVILIGR
jgi:hypothetical protein